MTMPKFIRIAPVAAVALALVAASGPASGAVTSRADNASAAPTTATGLRGWSAIAGQSPDAVIEIARTLPLSQEATGDQPWCAQSAEIARTLSHDFDERKVATDANGTALWGSGLTGTWTMVLERANSTSCVIASGIGYSDAAAPGAFFASLDRGR